MKSKYNLVVFDLDGTIADSDLGLVKIGLKMSETYLPRKDINMDDYLFLNGPTLDETMPYLFPGYPLEELMAKYNEYLPESVKDITMFKGAKELIKTLNDHNLDLALLTNRARASTEQILKRHGVHGFFKTLVCVDDGFKKKPSGEGLVHIMQTLKHTPDKTLFVGDNWRDILAGQDAGVDVAFIHQHRRPHRLDVSAKYVLDDISDVLGVLESDE
ncbi:MAG: Pyrophosphatase PpaX [Tenericutes bacterium ADurb.Bin087]|nr:MAG: Pyrophosphatase PpaX [Tenericutes bacterium ADurb.Bin087]